jgi:hypothetical protein
MKFEYKIKIREILKSAKNHVPGGFLLFILILNKKVQERFHFKAGLCSLGAGLCSLGAGLCSLQAGLSSLRAGMCSLRAGMCSLQAGLCSLPDGMRVSRVSI